MNAFPLPLAIFVTDAGGAITRWNPACEHLTGFNAAEIEDRSLTDLLQFEDAAGRRVPIAARVSHDSLGHLVCADGRQLPVRVTVAPQSRDTARPRSFTVIVVPRGPSPPPRYALIQDLPVSDIIEGLPCVFYVIDRSGRLLLWNRQLEQVLERPGDELSSVEVQYFFDESRRDAVVSKLTQAFEHGWSSLEAELVGRKGGRASYLFQCARTSIGKLPCVFGTGLDITTLKQAEQVLKVRERAIYASVNAICISCFDGERQHIEYVNPAFERITGYALAEIKGRDPRFMRVAACDADEQARVDQALRCRQSVHAVLRHARKNGEIYFSDLRIDPVRNANGKVTHFVAVVNDVTEARHHERRLFHLAHHDPLTGLANRMLLQEQLRQALEQAARGAMMGALAFLDLDGFKHINDELGHEVGDAVLRATAERLRAAMREGDTVARVGGDEFVLVMRNQDSPEQVADLLERVRCSVLRPIDVGGREVAIGTSIGVALFPRDGASVDTLMRAADAAMYQAKSQGKNNCQFFSEELNHLVHEHLRLESSLGRAIGNQEMVLDFQPTVDLRSGEMVGAEALVRWNHPEHGLMGPDSFIPVAEQTGLIVPLGEWVIDQACAALRGLRALGVKDFVISVNLTLRQLCQRQFLDRLAASLARHGVPPSCLELELTESLLMARPDEVKDVMASLKQLGVRLSIDDFGTGYSSLGQLQTFPVDHIKIDRSFLDEATARGRSGVTRAIIALGHSLRLKVVAEGVETREQLMFLRDHECDQMQGHYFSPPLSMQGLTDLLSRGVRLHG